MELISEIRNMSCVFCKKNINEKVKKFNSHLLYKSQMYLQIRQMYRLKFRETILPETCNDIDGYHVRCYKNFVAVMKKYRDFEVHFPRKAPKSSEQETAAFMEDGEIPTSTNIYGADDIKERKKSLRVCNREVLCNETPNTSLKRAKFECSKTPDCFSEEMVESDFITNIYFDPLDESNFDENRDLDMTSIKVETEDTQQEESHQVEINNYTDVRAHQETNKSSIEDFLQRIIKEMNEDNKDEDRQFMLSLVPYFKKLNTIKKIKAKIHMLKVLEKISQEK